MSCLASGHLGQIFDGIDYNLPRVRSCLNAFYLLVLLF